MSDSVRPHRRQPTRLPCPWDSPGTNTGMGCLFLLQCMKVKSEGEVAQSCPTLNDPMDCSPPGSSIHGIFQARVLEYTVTLGQITASLWACFLSCTVRILDITSEGLTSSALMGSALLSSHDSVPWNRVGRRSPTL